eukprot:gene7426-9128_t
MNKNISKFKHTYGTVSQQADCLYGLPIGNTSPDSNVIQANSSFFAFPCKIQGTVAVVGLNQKGTLAEDTPLLEHESQVNEINFSPFNENMLITACQDTVARIWTIPDGGLDRSLSNPTVSLVGNSKRLLSASFHPLAKGVAITTSVDEVKIWDVEQKIPMITLPGVHKGMVTSITWDYQGSLLATSCKDKMLRIFDPRSNTMVSQVNDHQGIKSGRAVWCGKKDQIFTIGFTKNVDREAAIWDVRTMKERIQTLKLDINPASPMPFYDVDTNVIFLGGKGEGSIKILEVSNSQEQPLALLGEFKHNIPASGMAMLPKSSCDVSKIEIARILKLSPTGQLLPIRFEVSRQNQFFDTELFPDTWNQEPTVSSTQWFSGENKSPSLKSLDPSNNPAGSPNSSRYNTFPFSSTSSTSSGSPNNSSISISISSSGSIIQRQPDVPNLNDDIQKKKAQKYDSSLEKLARKWIEDVLKIEELDLNVSLFEHLKNGVLLCKLVNTLKPGIIKRINESQISFKQLENIQNYLKACSQLGLQDTNLFNSIDLFENKDINLVITNILVLGKFASKVDGYTGPHLAGEKKNIKITTVPSPPLFSPNKKNVNINSNHLDNNDGFDLNGDNKNKKTKWRKSVKIPAVSSLNNDIQTKEAFKYSPELQKLAQEWIEDVLQEKFKYPSFINSLKDGIMLCK